MAFCPFRSTTDKTIECSKDCKLALNIEHKTICTITQIAAYLSDVDKIKNDVTSIADSVYEIKNQ